MLTDELSKDVALWRQALENARANLATVQRNRIDLRTAASGTQWNDLKNAEAAAQHYIWDIEIAFQRGENYLLWKLKS